MNFDVKRLNSDIAFGCLDWSCAQMCVDSYLHLPQYYYEALIKDQSIASKSKSTIDKDVHIYTGKPLRLSRIPNILASY